VSPATSAARDDPGAAVADRVPARAARLRWVAVGLLLAAALAVAVVVTDPFGGDPGSAKQSGDNQFATSLTTITRRTLTAQTQVSGTLGFPSWPSIRLPSGSSPASVARAAQAVAAAQAALTTSSSTQSRDAAELAVAQASRTAATEKRALDCAGDQAAPSPSPSPSAGGSTAAGASADLCASDQQAVASDDQRVTADRSALTGNRAVDASAAAAVTRAQQALAAARASASAYGPGAVFTALPTVGAVIRRGSTLLRVDGAPAFLLYGPALPWRAFRAGMSPGPDVAELNRNLRELGVASGLAGDAFTGATAAGIVAFQRDRGIPATGELQLGTVVFAAGAVRVSGVQASLGGPVAPGPVLSVTSAAQRVTIALDASQQSAIKVGDPITITLPDNDETPGRISSIARVATASGDGAGAGGGGGAGPTIAVDAVPTDAAAIGDLDKAPVDVSITTSSVRDALVVPIGALLALAGGGYALEEVGAVHVHHLLAVRLGLFDDADGLVEVTGAELAAGQRVVVPSA
jgi:hypothetical protein